ncbi:Pentatricopeptide repeat, partial [Dillenia turbinata]
MQIDEVPPNQACNVVFSIMLKACCKLRDFEEGRKLHCLVVKMGSPDSYVLTELVNMYAKCGKIGCSHEVFDEIVDHNVVSWTSIIAGYVQNDCSEEGLILLTLVESNQYTLGSLITACGKLGALHQGKWVHGGHPTEALKLFIKGKCDGFLPNSTTAASVLSACAQSGNLNLRRSVHGLGIQLEKENNAVADYQNEVEVGEALAEAFKTGLVKREDLFITTKTSLQKQFEEASARVSGSIPNSLPDSHWAY